MKTSRTKLLRLPVLNTRYHCISQIYIALPLRWIYRMVCHSSKTPEVLGRKVRPLRNPAPGRAREMQRSLRFKIWKIKCVASWQRCSAFTSRKEIPLRKGLEHYRSIMNKTAITQETRPVRHYHFPNRPEIVCPVLSAAESWHQLPTVNHP